MTEIEKNRIMRRNRFFIKRGFLVIFVCLLSLLMLYMGNTHYSLSAILRVIGGEVIPGLTFTIMELRLPRLLAAIISGFIFGSCGYIFQTMLRNPLANPNIIGITTGSSAFAVFCIVILRASGLTVAIISVIGALLTCVIIFLLANVKGFSLEKLILIGIGVQAVLNAGISYMLLKGKVYDVQAAMRWLSGSLNDAQLDQVLPIYLITLFLFPLVLFLSRELQLLELGDELAKTLGVNVKQCRIYLLFVSVCLLALATSLTGPIASVSFLAGPITVSLFRNNFSNCVNAGLIGVVLVIGADLVGQFAFSMRYPVGVITGILGSPYLLYLMIRLNKKGQL